jgi:hypothetical protein
MRKLAVLVALFLSPLSARAADCKHGYFPSAPGTTWEFKDEQGKTSTLTVDKVDGQNVTLSTTHADVSDPTKTNTVQLIGTCNADGLRMNLGDTTFRGKDAKGSVKTTAQEGVDFPNADKLKPGYTWTSSRTMEMSGDGGMKMTMTVKSTHKVVSAEKVKVEAGSYDTLKLTADNETTMAMDGPMAAMMNGKPPMKSSGTTWIAKGVGVVKTEAQVPNMMDPDHPTTKTTELVKFTAGK